jgi:hypothetical protein
MVINKILIAATSVLAMSGIIQARAESNGLALVERPATTGTVLSSPALTDTGSETYQSFAGPSVPVVSGQVLQPNGSEGIVQTANSLPRGFLLGTPEYDYAQSVQRYFAARTAREMLARATQRPHPG